MAIHRLAASDKEFVKLRAMLANAIVGQMLPDGAVKGGTALKFRFGDKATRFTTDLDAARQSDLEVFVERLETSLAVGWNGFEGRLVPREQSRPAHVSPQYVMRPFDIKMDYRGKPWCTVTLEVGHNELGDADEPERVLPPDVALMFHELGFPEPDPASYAASPSNRPETAWSERTGEQTGARPHRPPSYHARSGNRPGPDAKDMRDAFHLSSRATMARLRHEERRMGGPVRRAAASAPCLAIG